MRTQHARVLVPGLAFGLAACQAEISAPTADRPGRAVSAKSQPAAAGRGAGDKALVAKSDVAAAPTAPALLLPAPAPTPADDDADGGTVSGCDAGVFCPPAVPDPEDCGKLTLQAEVKVMDNPGNVLVIFDRSGSMREEWNAMPKWQTAGTALVNALQPLRDKLTIGAVLFPSPPDECDPAAGRCNQDQARADSDRACGVHPISAVDQIDFKPGAAALDELETGNAGAPKYEPQERGGTPTTEAIAQADTALRGMALTGTTAVVLITDGEPNCEWNQADSTAKVADWASSLGVKTYVIGLPGAADGGGPAVLTALAQAGQTVDYVTPTDATSLQTKLADIVSQTVTKGFKSCEIELDPAAKVPDKLHLLVTEQGQEQDVPHRFAGQTADAWTISKDGKSVLLAGNLCENVKAGTYDQITFVFGCVTVPPLPPPPAPKPI